VCVLHAIGFIRLNRGEPIAARDLALDVLEIDEVREPQHVADGAAHLGCGLVG